MLSRPPRLNFKYAGNTSSGFTLVEILVSMAILGVALIVLFELFSGALKLAKSSEDYLKAVLLAQKKMNAFRLVDFSMDKTEESGEFEEDPSYHWTVSSENFKTEFKRNPKNLGVKKIEVVVTWNSGSRGKNFSLVRLYTPILWHYPDIDPEKLVKSKEKGKEAKPGAGKENK